jgi:hypothetical protein
VASYDIKDAYYSCPIALEHRKYLKFLWRGQYYKYIYFANGLAPCPRLFTKLLKPPLALLRKRNHQSVAYIDDLYLQGRDFSDCMKKILLLPWIL